MITKNYFWIENEYLDIFNSASLGNPNTFYNNDVGRLIRAEPEKSIRYFTIKSHGKSIGFYIKNERPSFLSHLKYFLKKRRFYKLNTGHELELIRLYQSQGVSVVEPIALGEQKVMGISIRGFLVQREVVGQEFIDLIIKGSTKERIKLIKAYGKFVADLHSKGFISTVPRVTDLICTSTTDIEWQDIALVVIDREKGPLMLESFSIDKVGYALSSILVRFFVYIDAPSTKEILCFLRTYINNLEVESKPSLRDIFSKAQLHFNIMLKRYITHIGPAARKSTCVSLYKNRKL